MIENHEFKKNYPGPNGFISPQKNYNSINFKRGETIEPLIEVYLRAADTALPREPIFVGVGCGMPKVLDAGTSSSSSGS